MKQSRRPIINKGGKEETKKARSIFTSDTSEFLKYFQRSCLYRHAKRDEERHHSKLLQLLGLRRFIFVRERASFLVRIDLIKR